MYMYSDTFRLVVSLQLLAAAGVVVGFPGDVLQNVLFGTSSNYNGWIVSPDDVVAAPGLQLEGDRIYAVDDSSKPNSRWYFASPASFTTGDLSTLYGGFLSFELGHFDYDSSGAPVMASGIADVVLVSSNPKYSLFITDVYSDDGTMSKVYNVRLDEEFYASTATRAARWRMMVQPSVFAQQVDIVRCLQSLKTVKIRGGYYLGIEATFLRNISLVAGQNNKGGSQEGIPVDGVPGMAEGYQYINGVLTPVRAAAPPPSSNGILAPGTTCTSTDRYEIVFNRPGCGASSSEICNAATDLGDNVVHNLLNVESIRSGHTPVFNQNIGHRAAPIKKPFNKEYVFKSLPHICSAATLEIVAQGDLQSPRDYVEVYGEDGMLLGIAFAGNLSTVFNDERVSEWSATDPYHAAISIPQEKMIQYAADGEMTFRLSSPAGHLNPNDFSGIHQSGEISTNFCNAPPCDLSGSVIFRSMKIVYSPTPCFVYRSTSDASRPTSSDQVTGNAGISAINFTVPIPPGTMSAPSSAGAVTVVTDADVVSNYNPIQIRRLNPSNASADLDLFATMFTTPNGYNGRKAQAVTVTAWGGQSQITPFFADSASIPYTSLKNAVGSGSLQLQIYGDPNLIRQGHFSPFTVRYPLMYCFLKTIKQGPNMQNRLQRPQNLYFSESGFSRPASDVVVTVYALWQGHTRYTTQPGGNNPEAPLLRADSLPMGGGLNWNNYPDKIAEHQKWPHGYGYMQLRNGVDGELLADMFLKDYTQYSAEGYIADSAIIPKDKFDSIVANSNGVYSFSLWLPPGFGVIMLRSISFGYAVNSVTDAVQYHTDTPISFTAY